MTLEFMSASGSQGKGVRLNRPVSASYSQMMSSTPLPVSLKKARSRPSA